MSSGADTGAFTNAYYTASEYELHIDHECVNTYSHMHDTLNANMNKRMYHAFVNICKHMFTHTFTRTFIMHATPSQVHLSRGTPSCWSSGKEGILIY